MANELSFSSVKFIFSLFAKDDRIKNFSVEFVPLLSSGFHVKVAVNNAYIGDCVSTEQPSLDQAKKFGYQFLEKPVNYGDKTIPG